MKTELLYLSYTVLFTAIIWIPYVCNLIWIRGVADAVGYPENPEPLTPWAQRMKWAHYNAVENLVVFAALILICHAVGISNETIGTAATVYFWARVVHFVVYAAKLPWIRTIAFIAGFGCQITVALQIIA
jgi:uncharacterized MAPEG superfamily protein